MCFLKRFVDIDITTERGGGVQLPAGTAVHASPKHVEVSSTATFQLTSTTFNCYSGMSPPLDCVRRNAVSFLENSIVGPSEKDPSPKKERVSLKHLLL